MLQSHDKWITGGSELHLQFQDLGVPPSWGIGGASRASLAETPSCRTAPSLTRSNGQTSPVYLASLMKNDWQWVPEEERDGRAWKLMDGSNVLGDVVTYPGEARYYACDYVGFEEMEYPSMREAAVALVERVDATAPPEDTKEAPAEQETRLDSTHEAL